MIRLHGILHVPSLSFLLYYHFPEKVQDCNIIVTLLCIFFCLCHFLLLLLLLLFFLWSFNLGKNEIKKKKKNKKKNTKTKDLFFFCDAYTVSVLRIIQLYQKLMNVKRTRKTLNRNLYFFRSGISIS